MHWKRRELIAGELCNDESGKKEEENTNLREFALIWSDPMIAPQVSWVAFYYS